MKPFTISEYVTSFTRVPESTTPSKYIINDHTPLEPARNEHEEKTGVKLPGDQAEVVNNEFINNPQAALKILRENIADHTTQDLAYEAINTFEMATGELTFRRKQPIKPSKPSNIKPIWEKTGDELFPSQFKK